MFVKKIVRAVLSAVMVVAFCGCDLWMNDWKGYLEYWSEAVTMGRVEVSGATFQTNDAGVQTLPLNATAKISGYVINPQGHALLDSSIEINDPTLANSATKNVADPTLISVLLKNVTVAEHTTFTVNFTPERADNGVASTETMSVTLQYNTPPAAPLRMNSDGNGGFEEVQAGGTWNADNDGNLYWKWPYTTTSDIEPNAVKWFSIDGVLYELSECAVRNNSGIYSKNTGNKSVKLAAVDSEGIVGPSITSGVTVPRKITKITLDASNINSANDLRNELAKYSGCEITVDLSGKDLSVGYSDFNLYKEFFTVKDGTKVTITGGAIKVKGDFSSSSTSDNFFLFSVNGVDSSLTLSGCTLSALDANFGNVGMTAVKVRSGSVNLINTTISNIDSNGNGAGVYVESNGSVTMNGGAIRNNGARYGAAVYLSGGTFTMEGGNISNNACLNGSVISGDGRFVWNGGTISGNKNGSYDGGGVFSIRIEYGGTKNKNDAS